MAMVRKGLHLKFGKKIVQITASRVMVYVFVLALVCFTALPLIYVITTAFKPIDELLKFPPQYFFKHPTMQNFKDLILAVGSSSVPFLRNVANSVVIAVLTVVSTVFISSLGAYSLSKMDLPFKNVIFTIIIATLMFPGDLTTIPNYLIVKDLGMINTYWALILPKIGGAFNFFLIKQFCDQIPTPLLEAARIDGANEFKIFTRIVFPFLSPAWATMIVFCFIAVWNDGTSPIIYLTNDAMRTLPVAISSIAGGGLARSGAMAAGTLIMTAPTIIVYTAMQRNVIETMAHTGIK